MDRDRTVHRLPQWVPVCIVLESQLNPDLRGRRVRIVTGEGQWDTGLWYVYGPGVETDSAGKTFVDIIPESEFWRMRHTRQVDVSLVQRWPAGAVFLD